MDRLGFGDKEKRRKRRKWLCHSHSRSLSSPLSPSFFLLSSFFSLPLLVFSSLLPHILSLSLSWESNLGKNKKKKKNQEDHAGVLEFLFSSSSSSLLFSSQEKGLKLGMHINQRRRRGWQKQSFLSRADNKKKPPNPSIIFKLNNYELLSIYPQLGWTCIIYGTREEKRAEEWLTFFLYLLDQGEEREEEGSI